MQLDTPEPQLKSHPGALLAGNLRKEMRRSPNASGAEPAEDEGDR